MASEELKKNDNTVVIAKIVPEKRWNIGIMTARSLLIGAILTVLCHTLPAAAVAKFTYRPNEQKRLRQMQDELAKFKQLLKKSCNDLSVINELNVFAERFSQKYMLHLPLEDLQHHGKLLRLKRNDKDAIAAARDNKFVIDGIRYGVPCRKCSSGVQLAGTCDVCGGSGIYFVINKVNERQRSLFNMLMGTRLSDATKYNYLGTIYLHGRDGFPRDEERARLFLGMADRGFVREWLVKAKRAGSYQKTIAILQELLSEYPDRAGIPEAKRALAEYLHKFVVSEVARAKQKSAGAAVDILDDLVRNYPEADNIEEAKTLLRKYRCKFIAGEIAKAKQKSAGKVIDILDEAIKKCPNADNIDEAETMLREARLKYFTQEIAKARQEKSATPLEAVHTLSRIIQKCPNADNIDEAKTMLKEARREYIAQEIAKAEGANSFDAAADILEKAIKKCPNADNIGEAKEMLQQIYIAKRRELDQEVKNLIIRFYNSTSDSMYLTTSALGLIRPFAEKADDLLERHKSLSWDKENVLKMIWIIYYGLKEASKWEGISDVGGFERDATANLRSVRGDIEKMYHSGNL